MGTAFRKTITRLLPANAELFEKSRKPTVADRAENPDLPRILGVAKSSNPQLQIPAIGVA